MRLVVLALSLVLVSCVSDGYSVVEGEGLKVYGFDGEYKNGFSCRHESFPVPDERVDTLFNHARWLQRGNQLKRSVTVVQEVERLYRVAAEHGHHKANINLQNGGMRGEFKVKHHEYLRFSQGLIDSGVAAGYFFVAILLKKGGAGLQQDEHLSLSFFRKAADEGNPDAQAYIAGILAAKGRWPDIARDMRKCAAEQGHGKASTQLAINLKNKGDYEQSLRFLQLGVAGGYGSAASRMAQAFRAPSITDALYYLGVDEDIERARRYEQIRKILSSYSYANPTVPEINEILPLPPAKLPPWDGKLQWLEKRLANTPPPKPEEWLIEKLAKEKGLDPATGKPKPGSPAFQSEYFPADTCQSGEPCPQEGYWKVMWPESWVHNDEVIQHFNEGDLLPHPQGNYYRHRIWPLPRKLVSGPIYVKWGLLG